MPGDETNRVKVYGVWDSPFSKRVEIAMKMKGVDYQYIEEDILNKSPDLVKYNPVHKKVPVLVHNGKPIAESMVIVVEYIDETWKSGPAILPADPYERAMARFWADFIWTKVMVPLWDVLGSTNENKSKKLSEEVRENLRTLEQQLEGGNKKFFGGESVGYVDIKASFLALWFEALQEATGKEVAKLDDFPLLCKWKHVFCNWSVARETLPPKDKLVAHFRAFFESAGKESSSASE